MEEQLKTKIEEQIKKVLEQDINMNNIEYLYKLSKIKHMMKEDENMNYGNYGNYSGRGPGRGSYGEYGRGYGEYGNEYGNNYGRRGVDSKYRGYGEIDRMAGEYGRYQESRSYGAGEEADKSFHYMVKALEDFIKVLYEEATEPQQKQMLNETLQRSMM